MHAGERASAKRTRRAADSTPGIGLFESESEPSPQAVTDSFDSRFSPAIYANSREISREPARLGAA
jgi:hypothetical protein